MKRKQRKSVKKLTSDDEQQDEVQCQIFEDSDYH